MSEHFQVAIIGAGPAGIAAAASAARNGVSHVLFDKTRIANTIFEFQKKKHVMAEPRRLPLRSEIPFEEGTRESILASWEEAVKTAGIKLRLAEVSAIRKVGDRFELQVSGVRGPSITAETVVLAIGVQGTPRRIGCPGEDLPHVGYSLSDPDEFKGLHILVVGAGDAAIENALALAPQNKVAILNRSAEFARAKDANVKKITAAIDQQRIRLFTNATVSRIDPEYAFISTPDGEVKLRCDRVIVRAGAVPPRRFLESCGLEFPSKDPAATPVVNSRYESNVKGLHLVGALIGYPLIKQAMNQGFEVIEHILGREVDPSDAPLINDRLGHLPGTVEANYRLIWERTPLFFGLSEPQLRELIIESTVHLRRPGDVVFERLDYTDTFFSVISGAVDILVAPKRQVRIGAGGYFGEMSLLSGRRRAATVVAAETSILLETPRKQMLKLMSSVESVKRSIDEAFAVRLLETSVFPDAGRDFLSDLVKRSRMQGFKKDEVLFREGDEASALYVIRKGSVKVSRLDAGGVDIPRSYVAAGNFVGEMALLGEGERRTATVTAAVGCETLVIDRANFRQLLASNPKVRERVRRLAEQRRLENLTSDGDRLSGEVLDFMFRQGVTDASNVLVIDSDLCVACDNCESACAATHDGYSRLDRRRGKFFAAVQLPISCRHCENPLCMTDCPPDALTRQADGEVVIRDSCIGCGNCIQNCPYGVIQLVHEKPKRAGFLEWLGLRKPEVGRAKAAKCDLCTTLPGGPACVRGCPTGAAIRINPGELSELIRIKGGMRL